MTYPELQEEILSALQLAPSLVLPMLHVAEACAASEADNTPELLRWCALNGIMINREGMTRLRFSRVEITTRLRGAMRPWGGRS